MMIRLLLLLTVVPLVELAILFRIARALSWAPTLALVILTGAVGAFLARREGLKTVTRIQSDLERGVPPTETVVEGALILAAGLVLVTPGVITDIFGFALLVPRIRRRAARRLMEAIKRRIVVVHHNGMDAGDSFIDVDATSSAVDETDTT